MLSSDGPLDSNDLESRPCPALTEEDLCDHYSSRPFACRVFQPWSEWGPIKGCLRHPYNRDTTHELSTLLDRLAELNHAFVYRLGLHQSLDFDYLGNWAIADWFTTQEDGGDSARLWGF
jgi:Fe-S-cluster containining protein